MRTFRFAFPLALIGLGPLTAAAQAITAWEVGLASLGEGGHLLQVGYRASWVEHRSLGVDVSVASSPIGLMALLVHGAIDLDAAYDVELSPGVSIVGRAGGTAFVWAGQSGAGVVPGYNVGVGLVGRNSQKSGVRLDLVHRRFPTEYETYTVTSFTVGIVLFR